ncbi:MAG: DUF2235 domain-containing protein [Hyphomicrobiales bacterium]|nr:MAG: DUF2235 domain-containing protein [Hyphomicrobiales bacterium]
MARNIVIFADGTGQRGGVLFDECRSNIYKLYRATRTAPDSSIDPAEQLAFYDPGIGTLPKGIGLLGAIWQWLYNLISQATGLGLTRNIIDGYTAIIRNAVPGDRIYLIGFSRGAYTARCLAAVLAHCGIPTRMKDGSPLRRDEASARAIATEAVTKVYQHVSSERDSAYLTQRNALAARFRDDHGSGDAGGPNTYPYFIGVFDTVAALSNTGSLIVSGLIGGALLFALSAIGGTLGYGFWTSALAILGVSGLIGLGFYLQSHVKVAFGLPGIPWWKTVHLTSFRMKFYNTQLNPHVGYARHALSIDERRKDFDRVPWGQPDVWRDTGDGNPGWFKQIWFAGNHSDVGGSYPDSESRLSDISLAWMAHEAEKLPDGLRIDRSVLRLYPDPLGMQHDEMRSLAFRFAAAITREVNPAAKLHDSVYARLKAAHVLQYDLERPYRPDNLRRHTQAGGLFGQP